MTCHPSLSSLSWKDCEKGSGRPETISPLSGLKQRDLLDSIWETLKVLGNFLLLYWGLLRETACQANTLLTWRWLPTFEEMSHHKGYSSSFIQTCPSLLCAKDGGTHLS